MKEEKPLQCVGAICAYHARMAERSGKSIYLSAALPPVPRCSDPFRDDDVHRCAPHRCRFASSPSMLIRIRASAFNINAR
jgi:hypothetical protein